MIEIDFTKEKNTLVWKETNYKNYKYCYDYCRYEEINGTIFKLELYNGLLKIRCTEKHFWCDQWHDRKLSRRTNHSQRIEFANELAEEYKKYIKKADNKYWKGSANDKYRF